MEVEGEAGWKVTMNSVQFSATQGWRRSWRVREEMLSGRILRAHSGPKLGGHEPAGNRLGSPDAEAAAEAGVWGTSPRRPTLLEDQH